MNPRHIFFKNPTVIKLIGSCFYNQSYAKRGFPKKGQNTETTHTQKWTEFIS